MFRPRGMADTAGDRKRLEPLLGSSTSAAARSARPRSKSPRSSRAWSRRRPTRS